MRLICVCGRIIDLPSLEPGDKVRCPKCRAKLRIPTEQEDRDLVRWFCSCGQRLKARIKSSGREVNCPACNKTVTVPFTDKDDAFIDAKFLIEDSDTPSLPPAAASSVETIEEPSLRKERKQEAEIIEAEIVEGLEPDVSEPEPTPAFDFDEEQLELAPLPHEEAPTSPASLQEEPIPLAGFETKSPSGDADDAFELAAPPPQAPAVPEQAHAPHVPMTQPVQQASSDWDDEEEGIRARDLKRYFNVRGGVEAAKSGFTQVLNGRWLYVPYALLGGCMSNLAIILRTHTQGERGLQILLAIVPLIFSLYLYAAFVGCVKDGVFERFMGIERLLYHGAKHFLRFSGTALLMIPIAVGFVFVGVITVSATVAMAPGIMKIGVIGMTVMGIVFFFTLMMIPPIVSVLEETNPLLAVGRGLLFGVKNVWAVLVITVFSLFMAFLASLLWWYGRLLTLLVLGRWMWLFETVDSFVGGCIGAMLVGILTASIMVLYLSGLNEDRLQTINSKLRGPNPIMWRMYLAIGLGAIALIGLSFQKQLTAGDWGWIPVIRTYLQEADGAELMEVHEPVTDAPGMLEDGRTDAPNDAAGTQL